MRPPLPSPGAQSLVREDRTFLKTKGPLKRALERLGVCTFRTLFVRRRAITGGPLSVLVIRHNHLGDAVIASSFIAAIKDQYPAAAVDVLASRYNGDVFRWIPGVRTVHILPASTKAKWAIYRCLRRANYDLVFQTLFNEGYFRRTITARFIAGAGLLVGHARSTPLEELMDHAVRLPSGSYVGKLMALLEPLSGRSAADWTLRHPIHSVEIPSHFKESAVASLHDAGLMGSTPYAVLNISARDAARALSVPQARDIAIGLANDGWTVVLMAAPEDDARREELRRAVPDAVFPHFSSLGAAMSCVGGAALYVGPDTGSVHFAASAHVPCVVLFGPSARPDSWSPYGAPYVSIHAHAGGSVAHIPPTMVLEYARHLLRDTSCQLIVRPNPALSPLPCSTTLRATERGPI